MDKSRTVGDMGSSQPAAGGEGEMMKRLWQTVNLSLQTTASWDGRWGYLFPYFPSASLWAN